MSFVKQALNVLSGGIIGEVGKAIDDNVTSDEERGILKNELARISAKADGRVMDFESKINAEVTERHASDMRSDSWLSKNIRPLVLATLTLFTFGYIMWGPAEIERYQAGLGLLGSLNVFVYSFYFGSRGIEKSVSMIAAVMSNFKKKKEDNTGDLGW